MLVVPDVMYSDPLLPLVALPEPMYRVPLAPPFDVPELRTTRPLTPVVPELGVLRYREPLDVNDDAPLEMYTSPPVVPEALVSPADRVRDPPMPDSPEPTFTDIAPPRPDDALPEPI